MNKASLPLRLVLAVTVCVASFFAYSNFQQRQIQQQQLANYQQQLEQLLAAGEENSRLRLGLESQIEELQSELVTLNSQLTSSTNELQLAEQRSNPDYQALERDIRQRVDAEYRQRQQQENPDSRIDLVRQLVELPPSELGQLMALQGQFGGFLDSLDVSNQRMDEIVTALSTLMAEQNQARMDMVMSARVQQGDPRDMQDMQDMQERMMALSSPQAQREALSPHLSDEELDLLSEFQAQQPNPFYTGRVQRRGRDSGAIFLSNEQGGSATIQAQPIRLPN